VLGEVLTAIVTPFGRDGAVDFERFRELAQHLVESGSDGLVVAGSTGESPTLTDDERLELFRVAVDAVRGRGTVVAGTGTYDTAHSVHLTREAHELGVDGLLVVTPYYNKPPARGIVAHFRAIADVSDRPIIAYNIPGRVVINIEPETIVELAEIPTVRAVKQANDDLAQARRIVQELEPVYELLKIQTNPIAIKAALNLLGHDVGGLRLPLVEADEGEVVRVRDCLERLGLLTPVAA
jgi:4-hydroxy-tetrahydrodipicolinate synthase